MTLMWRCQMCNITLDEALAKHFPVLYQNNVVGASKEYYQQKADQYKWERTQKKPKDTCSWDCGQNFKAWRRTGEPKASYYSFPVECDCCGRGSTRGRVIKQRKKTVTKDFYLCIRCWRKKEIREGRRLWEIFNRRHRVAYARAWRRIHKEKTKQYKQTYLTKKAKGLPCLGKSRKVVCEASPYLYI